MHCEGRCFVDTCSIAASLEFRYFAKGGTVLIRHSELLRRFGARVGIHEMPYVDRTLRDSDCEFLRRDKAAGAPATERRSE